MHRRGDVQEWTNTAEVWYLRAELEREVIIETGAPSPGETSSAPAVVADTRDLEGFSSTHDVRDLQFAVIGAGRLGISLGLALVEAGAVLRGHTGRSPTGRARAESLLGSPSQPTIADLVASTLGPPVASPGIAERSKLSDPPVFLLTVPDTELPAAAQTLADAVAEHRGHSSPAAAVRQWSPAASERHSSPAAAERPTWAVIHTSGATAVSVLGACAAGGALTLSLHPLQTFSDPSRGRALLRGAAVAVTPGPQRAHREQAQRLGERLALAVGGRPFLLEEGDRTLYHAAAVVASNYLVTIEHAAERLFLLAGIPPGDAIEAFLPLAQGALDNIKTQGTVPALTGPLSRGDGQTVTAHLRALEQAAPDLADLYRTLGHATLALVRSRGELPVDAIDILERTMSITAERAPGTTTGAFTVMTRHLAFSTQGEGDVIDLTDRIGHLLRESGLASGTVTVFAPGATGAVTTLEFEPGVVHDFKQLFGRIVPPDDPYRHNLLLQDGNGHSHVRAGLLGPSLVIPFVNGRLTLGTWQEAVFVCFDNRPRDRRVIVQFMGVSEE